MYIHLLTEFFLDLNWGYERKGGMLSVASVGIAMVKSREMS